MESEGIFLKKIDRGTYRRLKSIAAERGVPVYQLLNEAMAEYVTLRLRSADDAATLERADSLAFEKVEEEASLRGKWVGLVEGAVIAKGDDRETVVNRMRDVYSKRPFAHGIVARVGGTVGEQREWLAGSIQQV